MNELSAREQVVYWKEYALQLSRMKSRTAVVVKNYYNKKQPIPTDFYREWKRVSGYLNDAHLRGAVPKDPDLRRVFNALYKSTVDLWHGMEAVFSKTRHYPSLSSNPYDAYYLINNLFDKPIKMAWAMAKAARGKASSKSAASAKSNPVSDMQKAAQWADGIKRHIEHIKRDVDDPENDPFVLALNYMPRLSAKIKAMATLVNQIPLNDQNRRYIEKALANVKKSLLRVIVQARKKDDQEWITLSLGGMAREMEYVAKSLEDWSYQTEERWRRNQTYSRKSLKVGGKTVAKSVPRHAQDLVIPFDSLLDFTKPAFTNVLRSNKFQERYLQDISGVLSTWKKNIATITLATQRLNLGDTEIRGVEHALAQIKVALRSIQVGLRKKDRYRVADGMDDLHEWAMRGRKFARDVLRLLELKDRASYSKKSGDVNWSKKSLKALDGDSSIAELYELYVYWKTLLGILHHEMKTGHAGAADVLSMQRRIPRLVADQSTLLRPFIKSNREVMARAGLTHNIVVAVSSVKRAVRNVQKMEPRADLIEMRILDNAIFVLGRASKYITAVQVAKDRQARAKRNMRKSIKAKVGTSLYRAFGIIRITNGRDRIVEWTRLVPGSTSAMNTLARLERDYKNQIALLDKIAADINQHGDDKIRRLGFKLVSMVKNELRKQLIAGRKYDKDAVRKIAGVIHRLADQGMDMSNELFRAEAEGRSYRSAAFSVKYLEWDQNGFHEISRRNNSVARAPWYRPQSADSEAAKINIRVLKNNIRFQHKWIQGLEIELQRAKIQDIGIEGMLHEYKNSLRRQFLYARSGKYSKVAVEMLELEKTLSKIIRRLNALRKFAYGKNPYRSAGNKEFGGSLSNIRQNMSRMEEIVFDTTMLARQLKKEIRDANRNGRFSLNIPKKIEWLIRYVDTLWNMSWKTPEISRLIHTAHQHTEAALVYANSFYPTGRGGPMAEKMLRHIGAAGATINKLWKIYRDERNRLVEAQRTKAYQPKQDISGEVLARKRKLYIRYQTFGRRAAYAMRKLYQDVERGVSPRALVRSILVSNDSVVYSLQYALNYLEKIRDADPANPKYQGWEKTLRHVRSQMVTYSQNFATPAGENVKNRRASLPKLGRLIGAVESVVNQPLKALENGIIEE